MSPTATETDGEKRVLHEARSGHLVDLKDLSDDQRVVSAEVIRRLCVGSDAESVDPRGIRIGCARIEGELDLSYCTLRPLCFEKTIFESPVDLRGARLPALALTGCAVPGLNGDGLRLENDLRLEGTASGKVRLRHATIGGELDCARATFGNEDGYALNAHGAEIRGSVILSDCTVTGLVRLAGATIGGHLDCKRSSFLTRSRSREGLMCVDHAMIGGDFECTGATFLNEDGRALSAQGTEIDGNVVFCEFRATGEVAFVGAKLGGHLQCERARFVRRGGRGYPECEERRSALWAKNLEVGGLLILRRVEVTGGVNLFHASASVLDDDLELEGTHSDEQGRGESPRSSWTGIKPLVLDGFAYGSLHSGWESPLREKWVKRTTEFEYGAWQQLIELYRRNGRKDQANSAAIAMHNNRLARGKMPWYRKPGRWLLRILVGHGYRPWLAGVWAVGIVAAFALVVRHWSSLFHPAKDVTERIQPEAYAADTFLPIVDLGQQVDFTPTGWVRWVDWCVILLGWALTTIFVAGFTRIVRSE